MDRELKNQRIPDDLFMKERAEVLQQWPLRCGRHGDQFPHGFFSFLSSEEKSTQIIRTIF